MVWITLLHTVFFFFFFSQTFDNFRRWKKTGSATRPQKISSFCCERFSKYINFFLLYFFHMRKFLLTSWSMAWCCWGRYWRLFAKKGCWLSDALFISIFQKLSSQKKFRSFFLNAFYFLWLVQICKWSEPIIIP